MVVLWATAPDAPAATAFVEPRVAEVTPSTVAPRTTPANAEPAPSDQSVTGSPTTGSPTTTVADAFDGATPSIADELPPLDRAGAIPTARVPRATPISVETTAFDATPYPVRAVGLEDDGQLEVPDETEIGWYRYGATAGAPGTTVLAAHVSWNGTTGPFFELGRTEPGDTVSVALDDGTTRQYEVIERARYEKDELPRDRIWRNTGPETLVMITCGGDFNPEIRRYRHNIVVYAVPVG